MQFLLQNLPILVCLLVGIALLVFEMFMPGFGLPGISGTLMLLASIVLTWTTHGPLAGLGVTLVVLALTGITATLSFKSASSGRLSRSPLILKDAEGRGEGYSAGPDLSPFLHREGIALTFLRPAGIAEIDSTRLDVVSDGEFIQMGARVRVTLVEGARIVVREVNT